MFSLFIALVAGAIGYFIGMQRRSAVIPTPVPAPTDPDHGRDPFVEPTFISISEARVQRRRFTDFVQRAKEDVNLASVLEDPVIIPDAIPAFTALFKLRGVTALRAYPILKQFDDGKGGKEEKLSLIFTAIDKDGNNVNPQRKRSAQVLYFSQPTGGGGSEELVENNNHPCKPPCHL